MNADPFALLLEQPDLPTRVHRLLVRLATVKPKGERERLFLTAAKVAQKCLSLNDRNAYELANSLTRASYREALRIVRAAGPEVTSTKLADELQRSLKWVSSQRRVASAASHPKMIFPPDVDWSAPVEVLMEKYGMGRRQALHAKRRRGIATRQTLAEIWKGVDWSRPTREIATERGAAYAAVLWARKHLAPETLVSRKEAPDV